MRSEIQTNASESEVDAALHMLTSVAAPEGLEERVHARVRARQQALAERRVAKLSYLRRPVLFALPVAVAALLIATAALHRTGPVATQSTQVAMGRPMPVVAEPSPVPIVKQYAGVLHASTKKSSSRTCPAVDGPPRREAPIQESRSLPATDATLTEQEKLLLAVARHSDAASRPEIAVLLVSERTVAHGLEQSSLDTSEATSE